MSGLWDDPARRAAFLPALAVTVALVWLAGVLPAIEIAHGGDRTHRCELCQFGQSAPLKPPEGLLLRPPLYVVPLAPVEPSGAERSAVFSWRSPRSPPA